VPLSSVILVLLIRFISNKIYVSVLLYCIMLMISSASRRLVSKVNEHKEQLWMQNCKEHFCLCSRHMLHVDFYFGCVAHGIKYQGINWEDLSSVF
jgi:hypothetical protein